MKSTSSKYGTVAVTIHWLSALLILVQLGSGFRAASMLDSSAKEAILKFHAPLGIAILVLDGCPACLVEICGPQTRSGRG